MVDRLRVSQPQPGLWELWETRSVFQGAVGIPEGSPSDPAVSTARGHADGSTRSIVVRG
jgi:hypothetical protein